MEKIAENILSWCNDLDSLALAQAQNISKHPCLTGNVCLMPDSHSGYGMPIGGVVALEGAISPNMVGVDIGCGMLAVKTSLTSISKKDLKYIADKIYERIPLGFEHHKTAQENPIFHELDKWNKTEVCKREFFSAQKQIGTLGGGNHFIEIQCGDDGHIWFMIHSGSRNLGKQVAEHYNDLAVKLCTLFRQLDVVKQDLAFLPVGTKEAAAYLNEMRLCLMFSYENRKMMAAQIKNCFKEVIDNVEFVAEINIHHNYVAMEEHFGKKVWVHRKGATLASKDTIGIIPGSQGSNSYIVQGLGNNLSMQSCSHGAGRRLSRSKAIKELDLAHEQEILNKQGIIHRLDSQELLDEAPSAYKNIDDVMEQQKDLVKIKVKLTPLAVIKALNEHPSWRKK